MTDLASPPEADFGNPPKLFDGTADLDLTPETADLQYWFDTVPQRTLRGHLLGHAPDVRPTEVVRRPGPLHDALTREVSFRVFAEARTARALGHALLLAPTPATFEFYATQVIDEARHTKAFRQHLVELGIAPDRVEATAEELAGADRDAILIPLEDFVIPVVRDEQDFVAGILLLTILVEGVLAPSFELSERKWRPFDPALADIETGAGIDEVRHLAVGGRIVRDHVAAHPEDVDRLADLVKRGMALMFSLPVLDQLQRWEALFQQGLEQHADLVGDYEIWDGRRLVDTTPDERVQKTFELTGLIHATRLTGMGLGSALG
ncbi:MAG: hypothetical protein AVDCRST_MAG41-4431 [uncultured Corynebacteriales bacterium]|uniref:VlmB-like protein n=1 Tax=uncultured Mycobacteriales bacterium TaxID=581187 RepID=A0A6J4JZN7_9ACTN|nr:MAG: hypothetical protein AVDCRST_MAG41-4431 [uncultured Corynebacteriales bacterium]